MFSLILIAAVLAEPIVNRINSNPSSTWVATEYPRDVMSMSKLRRLASAKRSKESDYLSPAPTVPVNDLPESFDARAKWGSAILPVHDQGNCGASWAVVVADVIGNRIGIQGCPRGFMSTEEILSCDTSDQGCKGGSAINAWYYVHESFGLSTDSCIPYTSQEGKVPTCPAKCSNGSKIIRTYLYDAYAVNNLKQEVISRCIFDQGPLAMYLDAYEDFMNYKTGIYQHKEGKKLGGLYVLVLGWGVENNVPYWICQNGYFRILRGSNHCSCETEITYGLPDCL
ncbi:MAG: putative cathepsin B2 cysteine protease [Streblomastix strix]|uniref:Putative cathepsin B2 cysteine protease n=1 Tax=Streblomastix strix TaxID=222440 RepID=A0A5J4W1A8_9EUKA|nr:MAG: putative cathepsin B2 cysteine protease [Streblomastix strix]